MAVRRSGPIKFEDVSSLAAGSGTVGVLAVFNENLQYVRNTTQIAYLRGDVWESISSNITAKRNTGYIVTSGSPAIITVPTGVASWEVGDYIKVIGAGGSWRLDLGGSDLIHIAHATTSAGGQVDSSALTDTIHIVMISSGIWYAVSGTGNYITS